MYIRRLMGISFSESHDYIYIHMFMAGKKNIPIILLILSVA